MRSAHAFIGRISTLLMVLLLTQGNWALADYVAYADDQPLPESIDSIGAKHLLNLKWGEYSGNKTRVGVLRVQNSTNVSTLSISGPAGDIEYTHMSGGIPVQGIEAILSDVLLNTQRFRVVERTALDKVLKEQDLGATGRISKPSAAKFGKVLGAQFLIQAVVTHYEPGTEEQKAGLGGLLGGRAGAVLGGLGMKIKKSVVAMNFRLISAETGEVLFSKQVDSVIDESGLTFVGLGFSGGGAGGFLSQYAKTPIGQAVIAAVNKGVYELIKEVGTAPPRGAVVKTGSGKVYVNLGEGQVATGDELKVLSQGEKLIDPTTGEVLGSEETEIGKVQVTSVKEKFSIAKWVGSPSSKVEKGSPVESTRRPEALKFAASWKPAKKKMLKWLPSSSDSDE